MKCGNCKFAISTTWGNKPSDSYVECTNAEHIAKYCKRPLSAKRPKSTHSCKSYVEGRDG